MILDNLQKSVRDVADDIGISFGLGQAIFTDDLGIIRAAVNIISKLLNIEQKQCRMDIAQEIYISIYRSLKKVITGDE